MIQIDDKIISLDVLKAEFCCNIAKCKGQCCVEGDSGAPLEEEEVSILEEIYSKVKSYLTQEGRNTIETQGTSLIDDDGDTVTPLIDNKACAFVNYNEKGDAYCGIEKAWQEKKISFRKPISCHLYPIRIKKYKDFEAVNYDQWNICQPAKINGSRKGLPLFKFLEEAITRKYGEGFFKAMLESYEYLKKNNL